MPENHLLCLATRTPSTVRGLFVEKLPLRRYYSVLTLLIQSRQYQTLIAQYTELFPSVSEKAERKKIKKSITELVKKIWETRREIIRISTSKNGLVRIRKKDYDRIISDIVQSVYTPDREELSGKKYTGDAHEDNRNFLLWLIAFLMKNTAMSKDEILDSLYLDEATKIVEIIRQEKYRDAVYIGSKLAFLSDAYMGKERTKMLDELMEGAGLLKRLSGKEKLMAMLRGE